VRRRTKRTEAIAADRGAGGLGSAISRHPREFVGIVMASAAMLVIFINALFLQKGPHPAPIFVTRPLPTGLAPANQARPQNVQSGLAVDTGAQSRVQLIAGIQRELTRRGFYEGSADGIWGAKTDAGVRDFVQSAGLKINPEASEGLLRALVASNVKSPNAPAASPARNDPIAKLIAPSKRVLAIQRALADFGYGQIMPTGLYDPDTRTAIEKFERDHRLPVTGQLSDRFVRELAAMTGRPLE
jgi:peptidoglycan hydrolase-like protein with peptidoglycan-binding domain